MEAEKHLPWKRFAIVLLSSFNGYFFDLKLFMET